MNSPTNFLPPQSIISNGQITGNSWSTPENIFLVDGDFATSNVNAGSASDFIVGNFNLNIPVGSQILGIEIEIIGKRGAETSPIISLDVSAYNNVNGADDFYPYSTPITSLTEDVTTVVIGGPTFLFSRSWTIDEINNFKLALTANGDISLDSVLIKVFFLAPATETIQYNSLVNGPFEVGEEIIDSFSGATAVVVTDNASSLMTVTNVTGFFQSGDPIVGQTSGATANIDAPTPGLCIDCSSPIQVQAMYLELPFLVGETKFYLQKGSFAYPDGRPVQPGDIGSCGGSIPFVFDESKRKAAGQNFEENAMLDTNNGGTWTVLTSGVIEVDLGFVTQRGLDFKAPGGHVAALMSDHDANSKVIISNNEPYNLTLVRACQADTLFSVPITIKYNGTNITTSLHSMNFIGDGVDVTLSSLHNVQVNIHDHFVGISIDDTTPGYLADKLIAGAGITLTPSGPGNEHITITNTGGGGGGGGISSINGDTTIAQTLQNATNGYIDIVDNGTGTHTFGIDISGLANDSTFIDDLTGNTDFQTNVNSFININLINPSVQSFLFEDFIGGGASTTEIIGELGWSIGSSGAGAGGISNVTGPSPATNPGNVLIGTGNLEGNVTILFLKGLLGETNTPNTTLESCVIPTSASAQNFFGLNSTIGAGDYTSATVPKVGFVGVGGSWYGYASDGTNQNVTSAVGFTGGYEKLKMVLDATGANVDFLVNGVLLGTIAVPVGATQIAKAQFAILTLVNANKTLTVDYFSFNRTLTR